MEDRTLLDFLKKAENLKNSPRHSWTSSGRRESVAEHSWRLALMAYLMKDEYPDLDLSKVMLMGIVHDLGEAVTGDIPAFLKTEEDEEVENRAIAQLFSDLPETYRRELADLFSEMEARETPEAKLYKALDKLEALIQHNEADISTWLPLEYDYQMTYGTEECAFDEYICHLRETVREDSREKIRQKQLNQEPDNQMPEEQIREIQKDEQREQ